MKVLRVWKSHFEFGFRGGMQEGRGSARKGNSLDVTQTPRAHRFKRLVIGGADRGNEGLVSAELAGDLLGWSLGWRPSRVLSLAFCCCSSCSVRRQTLACHAQNLLKTTRAGKLEGGCRGVLQSWKNERAPCCRVPGPSPRS